MGLGVRSRVWSWSLYNLWCPAVSDCFEGRKVSLCLLFIFMAFSCPVHFLCIFLFLFCSSPSPRGLLKTEITVFMDSFLGAVTNVGIWRFAFEWFNPVTFDMAAWAWHSALGMFPDDILEATYVCIHCLKKQQHILRRPSSLDFRGRNLWPYSEWIAGSCENSPRFSYSWEPHRLEAPSPSNNSDLVWMFQRGF